ncbi:MAG: hypothetical protein F4092_16720 [Rhodospirillaceae bacterium]|nr:hypothetical protein [Rhodospirillaceae bacterium]MYJ73368.1 hypothetical protein [Rhodospirillaceae bacterium]
MRLRAAAEPPDAAVPATWPPRSAGAGRSGADLTSPDFVRLAESFGARGLHAETPEDLRLRLREAFEGGGPTAIEVPVGDFPSPWEFLRLPKVRVV